MQRCGIHAVSCTGFLLYGSVAVLYQLLIKKNRFGMPDRLKFYSELTLLCMLLRRSLGFCNNDLHCFRLNAALVQRNAAVARRNSSQVRLDLDIAYCTIGIIFESDFTQVKCGLRCRNKGILTQGNRRTAMSLLTTEGDVLAVAAADAVNAGYAFFV